MSTIYVFHAVQSGFYGEKMSDVVICHPLRTPVGRMGGVLAPLTAAELATITLKALVARSGLGEGDVDDVILGNGYANGEAPAIGRIAALDAGLGTAVPGLQIDRRCGSGLQAILLGANEIRLGNADFVLAGGGENMSLSPHLIRGARWGLSLGDQKLEDYLWVALVDSYNGLGMANTAENLGRKYGITREAADEMRLKAGMQAVAAVKATNVTIELPG